MEKNKLVSIIVPVHNSENFIDNIISNVKRQDYTNVELIIVDDHSKDKTKILLDDKLKELCIKNFVFENCGYGVSDARNTGITHANGEYIAFIDDDDLIAKDYISTLLYNAMLYKADLTMVNYCEVRKEVKVDKPLPWSGIYYSKDIMEEIIPPLICTKKGEKTTWLPVWRTLINTNFIKEKNIRFESNVSQAEDYLFILELLTSAKQVYFINSQPKYFYQRRVGSSMNRYEKNALCKQEYRGEKLKKILQKNNIFEYLGERYWNNRLSSYSILLSNSVRKRNAEKSQIKREMSLIRKAMIGSKSIRYLRLNNQYLRRSVILGLFLLKYNRIDLLILIYSIKENKRLKRFN